MPKISYKKTNDIIGWFVFFVALTTYSLTVEPTASYWDAGEYISTSAKLQIGHPPGAPFYQMMGAIFSLFASNNELIALSVNFLSVVSSAFVILFLFWSTTLLLSKIFHKEKIQNQWLIFLSSSIGALAFTFSDSFWFNAVESEVYALAMLFLSATFWAGLRWEKDFDNPRGDKWLLLISFLIGLSFGVHFMAILSIPAIGMIYFFKKYKKITLRNFLFANIISLSILLFIFKLLLPSTLSIFGQLEVFFVNSIGLPFNSGTIIAALLMLILFYRGLAYTNSKGLVQYNTLILCILFVFIGFSSWLMIPIRSNANTVINENSPSDARTLLAYYRLEQYPKTYLFYGPMFSDVYAPQDQNEPYVDGKPKYERDYDTKKYKIVNYWENSEINSNAKHRGLIPRLWSSDHAGNYMNFTNPLKFEILDRYKNEQIIVESVNEFRNRELQGEVDGDDYNEFFRSLGPYLEISKPSLFDNLNFLFSYQINYMYWRYFMWNFAGRQNDIQGDYSIINGNWISGIKFLDEIRIGNQSEIHEDQKNNKARNRYYFLPLLLGILGLLFCYKHDIKSFWTLLLLFLFTGLALKFYLNERPFEPRERDYALVGSFYVFSIWIGMGFAYLSIYFNLHKRKILNGILYSLCLISVPFLMAYENWDDHDRSNRYTAQSLARAYLQSIDENKDAMIFTIGDNDTFALWYAQEIEEFRTDVRTINTSLLATDWYIDQMKRKAYESNPIPSQMIHENYAFGIRDYIRYENLLDSVRWDINDFMDWVASDNPRTKYRNLISQSGGDVNDYPVNALETVFYPTNKIRVKVNKENVIQSGLVKEKDKDLIVDYIDIDLPESIITKNQIMMLDILANNDWKRPIYFTGGSYADSEYIWMKDYLQLDGLVYKLVPIKTPIDDNNPYEMGRIDSNLMYDIVKKWSWGNSERSDIYHDPETRKNSISFRSNLSRLSNNLILEGENQKAEEIIDLAFSKMPIDFYEYYSLWTPFIEGYYKIGKRDKAINAVEKISFKYYDRLNYFSSIEIFNQYSLAEEIISDIERYRNLIETIEELGEKEILAEKIKDFINVSEKFNYIYGEFDYYMSLNDFLVTLIELGEFEYGKEILDKTEDLLIRRVSVFSNLDEDEQIFYIDGITTDINNYSRLINQIEEFDLETFQSYKSSLEELLTKIVE
jgi:hypothetical protein